MRRFLLLTLAAGCNQVLGLGEVSLDDAMAVADGAIDGATDGAATGDGGIADSPGATIDASATCGDGIPDQGEECDDDNNSTGDGCANCLYEFDVIGCADGRRDGFEALATFPGIAACAGGWGAAGLRTIRSSTPACARAGDDGPNPAGTACSAANLCAANWHICGAAADIASRLGTATCTPGDGFFATQQPTATATTCGMGTAGVIGCGSVGDLVGNCVPLNRAAGPDCATIATTGWACAGFDLPASVTHGAGAGGLLCCK